VSFLQYIEDVKKKFLIGGEAYVESSGLFSVEKMVQGERWWG
jgi:hypothetical protein